MPTYRLPINVTDPRAGKCVNVWHIRTAGIAGDETANVNAAAAALRAFYVTMAPHYAPGVSIAADFAVDVAASTDQAVTWAPVAGSGASPVAPPHISVCVTWKTSVRGRRARGRTFLGPHVNGSIDADGTVNAPVLTSLKTAADALVAASIVDNGWAIGIYGQQDSMPGASAAARAAAPHVIRDIVGWSVSDKFAVMRSRRP